MKCLNCGEEFTPVTVVQKYCSVKCRGRYNNTHDMNEYYPPITFQCAACGKTVTTEGGVKDKRTRFCCQACEKRYWKHPPQDNPHFMVQFHSVEEYGSWERRTNE